MIDDYILTASNMPDCAAAAAFANVALKWNMILIPHTRKLTRNNLGTSIIPTSNNKHLIVIGSFWNDQFDMLLEYFDTIRIYTYGDNKQYTFKAVDRVNIYNDMNRDGAIDYIYNLGVQNPHVNHDLLRLFMRTHKELINMCNQRCFGIGNDDTQIFFTGVCSSDDDLFQTFKQIFDGSIEISSIMERGATLIKNNKNIAKERAEKNSKLILLKNGRKALITESTELVNFTHEALRNLEYGVDFTITFRISFAQNPADKDKICFSVRSVHDGNIKNNALEVFEKEVNAGGNESAAGCQFGIDMEKIINTCIKLA